MGTLDGGTISALLIGFTSLITFLLSQNSAKAREQRRRMRVLTKRDIAWSSWGHRVLVWAAGHGYDDIPKQPAILTEDDDEEAV
jgi:hypothetical protein